jgi:hypothetical protein
MSDEHEPPRLANDPAHADVIRALREDAPSAELDKRILATLYNPPTGVGGGGGGGKGLTLLRGTTRVLWAVGLTAAIATGIAVFAMGPEEETTSAPAPPHEVDPAPSSSSEPSKPVEASPLGAAPSRPKDEPRRPRSRHHEENTPAEAELIVQARAKVQSAPRAATRILARHERLYPKGVLEPEREALKVELVIRSGDRARADQALRRFERAHAGSAHSERLRRLLSTLEADDAPRPEP